MTETLNNENKGYSCHLCEYSSDHNYGLTQHLSFSHNIGVEWYRCPKDECKYKSKAKGNLTRHLRNIHNVDVKMFYCPEEKCNFRTKSNSVLKKHLSNIHDINVKWFYCPEEKCNFRTKEKSVLKKHLRNIHDIGVNWFHCDIKNCDYKSKCIHNLKRHISECMGKGVGSNGEKYVKKCLSDLGFVEYEDYIFDKTFFPLTQYCGKSLRFDFRFFNHNIIIEYDGKPHFEVTTGWTTNKEQAEENFKRLQEHDKLKNDFCKENNFKMIRIPYTKFADTLSILSAELHDIVDWVG